LWLSSQSRLAAVEPAAAQHAPQRSGPKINYEPAQVLPALKAVWLASDPLCSKRLKAALRAAAESF